MAFARRLFKRGEDPDVVLNQLWKHTSLQHTFGINMIALTVAVRARSRSSACCRPGSTIAGK